MAKAKPGAKKPQPKSAGKKAAAPKMGLLKSAAAKLVKTVTKKLSKATASPKKAEPPKKQPVEKPAPKKESASAEKPARKLVAAEPSVTAAPGKKVAGGKGRGEGTSAGPVAGERQKPRSTKLPALGTTLTKREMEQILTVGQGRGVAGEGSLKGRLILKDGLPHLLVTGRDKRELGFVLQGPDQEVLPAYVEHKVSVSGLIRKLTSYGGAVDVRKYSAKKTELEPVSDAPVEQKLRFLSPGETEQVCNAGMGAGMHGFATVRGNLELTGEDFLIVVSNGGTRQQVSFVIDGKIPKAFRKHVGQTVQATGVVNKTSGWGGKIATENLELRPTEFRAVSRESLEMTHLEGSGAEGSAEVRLNQGLTVRLPERAGHTWAIEPTMAKRIGLREANFELPASGNPSREFFFTPRNPGSFEVEFFLAKVLTPAQVARSYKLALTVKP